MRYEFQFNNDNPFCWIEGGEYDKKKISVNEVKKNRINKKEVEEMTKELGKDLKQKKLMKLQNMLERQALNKEMIIDDGILKPYVNKKQKDRFTYYISGANGCGKSTFISFIIQSYKKAYKNGKIYLFSEKDEDQALDKFNPIRIELDEELIKEPISLDEFPKNSLVIFDDIDSIANKKLKHSVYNTINLLLKVGRSAKINTIVSSHMMSNYAETRHFINESANICIFPQTGSVHYLQSFLKKYIGLSKKEINDVLDLDTRYCVFHKNIPKYYWHQHGCKLIR